MKIYQWNDPVSLRHLLCELVSWESITHDEGEQRFPHRLEEKLMELNYFATHPSFIELHDVEKGRHAVTALYKSDKATDTIVLISHFDTVGTDEYGDLGPLAFQPEELTKVFKEKTADLPNEVVSDLLSGEYLFGRGTMDMKMGLALHMRLLEQASIESWPINLLLVTVPDEEVNSDGMRAVIPELIRLQEEHGLDYRLFLNSEPSFSQKPGDEQYYMYTGTIGKIMPAALFYGKETHAGEPMNGMTAHYIASFFTQQMEWSPWLRETDRGEATPLPVTLQQKDLKMAYSTQTPHRVSALYNVFLMKQSAADVMETFQRVAQAAADACNEAYRAICTRESVEGIGHVTVLRYEELLKYANEKLGVEAVTRYQAKVLQNPALDDREKSIRIADTLMIHCQELGPAIVLLFAPPYYPAVNSSDDLLIKEMVDLMKQIGSESFNLPVNQIHYFNGISDLSYVRGEGETAGWDAFKQNTPVWGETYTIPFYLMKKLQAPVLNIGPLGKDAHKLTERLHINSAFVQLPSLLEALVRRMFVGK